MKTNYNPYENGGKFDTGEILYLIENYEVLSTNKTYYYFSKLINSLFTPYNGKLNFKIIYHTHSFIASYSF